MRDVTFRPVFDDLPSFILAVEYDEMVTDVVAKIIRSKHLNTSEFGLIVEGEYLKPEVGTRFPFTKKDIYVCRKPKSWEAQPPPYAEDDKFYDPTLKVDRNVPPNTVVMMADSRFVEYACLNAKPEPVSMNSVTRSNCGRVVKVEKTDEYTAKVVAIAYGAGSAFWVPFSVLRRCSEEEAKKSLEQQKKEHDAIMRKFQPKGSGCCVLQ